MRRMTVEERRTLSSLSLEIDASGRLNPLIKVYFEASRYGSVTPGDGSFPRGKAKEKRMR